MISIIRETLEADVIVQTIKIKCTGAVSGGVYGIDTAVSVAT